MLAAYIAITATAGATIFPHHQPWSALIPLIVGEAATIGFLLHRSFFFRSAGTQIR